MCRLSKSRALLGFVLLFAAVLLIYSCSGSDSNSSSKQARVLFAVNEVRSSLAANLGNKVPSLNLIIQTVNETIFVSASDTPDQAITEDAYFRFASNTKNFTSTAILKMHQDGWLDIKDRIVEIIPGSNLSYVPDTADWDVPYKEEITIEQLLQHSAGVYDVDNNVVPGCEGLTYTAYITQKDPNHQFTADELVGQAAINQLSYFLPGEGYHYSNTGYSMLGEIISRVYSFRSDSPKTYTDYLNENITGGTSPVPLDMGFPYLATDQIMPEPHVCGTVYAGSKTEVICKTNMSAQVAEGNGFGTMRQVNRYIRSLMRGENVLQKETVHLMQQDVSESNSSYALGCEYRENLGYGHNGARVGNLSLMAYNPDNEVSVVVYLPLFDLSNGMESFILCYNSIYEAAYAALETLGYPGKPK